MPGLQRLLACLALGLGGVTHAACAQELPRHFTPSDTQALLGSPNPLPLEAELAFARLKFERPVELTFASRGDDRLFVAEQGGTVRVFTNHADVDEATVFLDLRDVTLRDGNEEGLLGLAFHPRYAENGKFYVYYSTRPQSSVIAEFQVSDDPNKADRASERRLLVLPQPFPNHNGGSIQFGQDGCLYIGLGDGGGRDDPFEHAQNLGSILGKVLRIDVDGRGGALEYAIPPDNPFVEVAGARGEIWSYGHRNIWRLGFDSETGDLWAGEVGQDRFEEINFIERGGNYGWNLREGRHDFQPSTPTPDQRLTEPVAEYFRGEGQSVTGGFVYRGERLAEFVGRYFYGDYLSGNVWTLTLDDARRGRKPRQVARTGLQIAAFGRGADEEMYLCAFDGGIYRLRKRSIDIAAERNDFPKTLSATGLFASVADNRPAAGLIPYELNVPFWSDYAVKERYLALPENMSIEFSADNGWKFPRGTVLVKTFWMHADRKQMRDARRLETRLLVHGDEGWNGYTYVYDDDGREARLLEGSALKSLKIQTADGEKNQSYYFPSRSDCLSCHTKQHGFVLGLETAQLNRTQTFGDDAENQLAMLDRLGVFAQPLEKKPEEYERFPDWGFGNWPRNDDAAKMTSYQVPKGETRELARAWLDVNCSMCHLPDGIAPMKRDLRFATPLEKMNLVDQPVGQRRRRPEWVRLIVPGDPTNSDLLWRVGHRGEHQMPPLATHEVDPHGYEVVRRWIAEVKSPAKAED